MAELKEARVPDIGDDKDVPVIELLVAVGDTVKKDQGLVTLESDKATMEVPAPFDGVVRELKVKIGDELSEGSVVALIEPSAAAPTPAGDAKPVAPPPQPAPASGGGSQAAAKTVSPATPAPAQAAPTAAAAEAPTRSPPVAFDAEALLPGKVPHASPAVRLFARELG
ncbi:MAG TPA: biotin/lipoyl-containing protein, partial [Arenimonas sp.]|nr:biotin/lipoyl-containing protein [Arenimonas sp.]